MTGKTKSARQGQSPQLAPERMDARQRRTREAILRAAQVLFAEHHPEDVSMDDLIRTADVSKQSFYNHFADKHALAREILRVGRTEMEVLVEQANRGEVDPAMRVANGLCVYAAQALSEPAHAKLLVRVGMEDLGIESAINAHIVEDMREGLRQHRLNVLTLEAGTAFTIGVGSALVTRLLEGHSREMAVMLSQQLVTLTLRAFGLDSIEAERIASEAAERIIRPAAAQ